MIKSGRAPLEIMNVQQHQEVEVKVEQHDGNYVAPKKIYKPFGSGGQRLGSPIPGVGTRADAPAEAPAAAAISPAPSAPAMDINEAEPIISLQIRLGDGTRLVSRFNTSHTIGDVYSFVEASSPASRNRPWALMTTFPTKELSDKSQALGDLAEFKRGGVVVQKWQ
jgi:UBX domain-containing protein 1